MDSQLKHDFINNGLRIEVLNKLISESLEKSEPPLREQVDDLLAFLQKQIEYLTQF
jgi:hypothetical protein